MKVSFGTQLIQKGRRIAVGQDALENLGLKIGDTVKIFLDTDSLSLVIEPQIKTASTNKSGRVAKKNG